MLKLFSATTGFAASAILATNKTLQHNQTENNEQEPSLQLSPSHLSSSHLSDIQIQDVEYAAHSATSSSVGPDSDDAVVAAVIDEPPVFYTNATEYADINGIDDTVDQEYSVVAENAKSQSQIQQDNFNNAVKKVKGLAWAKTFEVGSPSLIIGVSVDGKQLWAYGFGYADVENQVLANSNTVMRIASISKAITMAAVAKLVEEGKLDLDKPISQYLTPEQWPRHHPDITCRQLASHTAGVRHYDTKEEIEEAKRRKKAGIKEPEAGQGDAKYKEFYRNEKYENVSKSLNIFNNDNLLAEPGSEFNYTTHGFTVLSAIVEKVSGESFEKRIKRTFKELGLNNTFLDENGPVIANRARYYFRDSNHILKNSPSVDNSYKWAGGGFLSTVGDLLKFGNAMLYSYQQNGNGSANPISVKENTSEAKVTAENVVYQPSPFSVVNRSSQNSPSSANNSSSRNLQPTQNSNGETPNVSTSNNNAKSENNSRSKPNESVSNNINSQSSKPGYLKKSTIDEMWKPVIPMAKPEDKSLSDACYGLGWMVMPRQRDYAFARNEHFYAAHTGAAIGTSSVLLILPRETTGAATNTIAPQGVVVAILCNMQGVGLTKLAHSIAKEFSTIRPSPPSKVQKVYNC